MLTHPRSILIPSLTVAVLGAVLAQTPTDMCKWKSATEPSPLTGTQGGASSEFAFTYMSDVDVQKNLSTFMYSIHNDHGERLLPVEWLNGRDEYVLKFERIAPNGCAFNSIDSYLKHKVDPEGQIKYGPTLESKKTVEIYDRPQMKPEAYAKDGELKSVLYADLQDDEGKPRALRLELSSRVSGSSVAYVLVNRSKESQVFEIPPLSTSWDVDIPGVEFKSRWPVNVRRGEFDQYTIAPEQRVTFEVSVPNVALVPQFAMLRLRSSDGAVTAIGRVAIHLPVVK